MEINKLSPERLDDLEMQANAYIQRNPKAKAPHMLINAIELLKMIAEIREIRRGEIMQVIKAIINYVYFCALIFFTVLFAVFCNEQYHGVFDGPFLAYASMESCLICCSLFYYDRFISNK